MNQGVLQDTLYYDVLQRTGVLRRDKEGAENTIIRRQGSCMWVVVGEGASLFE